MMFWILIFALALAAAALLALALLRRRDAGPGRAEFDIAVYRDQLAAVDSDLARGVITEDAAARTRTEISRRILDADRQRDADAASSAPRRATLIVAALSAAALAGGSLALYARLGAPGYGDLPLKTRIERAEEMRTSRPGQAEAEAQLAKIQPPQPEPDPQFAELVQRLRDTIESRPDDPRGLELLANNEAALGNYAAAHAAQERRIAVLADKATADDWATLADLLVIAAGGYVSPEAERALAETLRRDPQNGPARYYFGLMRAQTGRPDLAFRVWRQLLEESVPEAPWVIPIREQIGDMALRAGVDYEPPADGASPLRGPNADDVAAASDMTPEERMEMIQSMVERLSARLAEEGGPPGDWARLITALGVLGDPDRAKAIYAEGLQVFAADAQARDALAAAAERAGVGP
ncbi:MAG: c-type cytochrome biogenesis protein CcmI [Rhodobacteraceae bacterium]|nr:c-type cytochrome biogenesis protein CcmI [Paracoccaceae bacterium]